MKFNGKLAPDFASIHNPFTIYFEISANSTLFKIALLSEDKQLLEITSSWIIHTYIYMCVCFTAEINSTKGQYNIAGEIIRCRKIDKQIALLEGAS